ncbi:hypothetical protein C0J52_17293, partial [Blattella germanica]
HDTIKGQGLPASYWSQSHGGEPPSRRVLPQLPKGLLGAVSTDLTPTIDVAASTMPGFKLLELACTAKKVSWRH